MAKIRWTIQEREMILGEVMRQRGKHPTMPVLDLVRMAQKITLTADRRRELKGNDQVKWVVEEITSKKLADLNPPPYSEPEPEPEPEAVPSPIPDLQTLLKVSLKDFLKSLILEVVRETLTEVKEELNIPVQKAEKHQLKRIAVYGLFSTQVHAVRTKFKDCFEFRFLKDVSQKQLVSAAQWADHFIIMTKFVSHDYGAIRAYSNVEFLTGAASALDERLERIYLEEK